MDETTGGNSGFAGSNPALSKRTFLSINLSVVMERVTSTKSSPGEVRPEKSVHPRNDVICDPFRLRGKGRRGLLILAIYNNNPINSENSIRPFSDII